jgi:hypothetical protein
MKFKLFAITVLLLIPLCCHAQEWKIGFGLKTSVLNYNRDELDTSNLLWGGHARVRAFRYFAGELSVQRREDTFGFRDGEIILETVPVQLSAIVYPLANFSVTPYFVGGTGWYYLTATIHGDLDLPYVFGEGSIKITETAPHIGVGVEAFLGDHVSLGADIRKVFLEFNTSLINYKFDAYFVNVGATFYF